MCCNNRRRSIFLEVSLSLRGEMRAISTKEILISNHLFFLFEQPPEVYRTRVLWDYICNALFVFELVFWLITRYKMYEYMRKWQNSKLNIPEIWFLHKKSKMRFKTFNRTLECYFGFIVAL